MAGLELNVDWKSNRWGIAYCLVAAIGALCYGYDTIYYTGIQGMKWFAKDYGEQTADGSWVLGTTFLSLSASIIYVGELAGAIAAAPINDFFGRRIVFLSASLFIIIGAVVQACSFGSDPVFYVSRVLIGLGIGQFTATCLMYIGEVAPSAIRGPALMSFQFMQSISQLVGACVNQGTEKINSANSYRIPMCLLVVLPAIMLLCLPFTPESPVWYMYKNKRDQAIKALRKINRSARDYDPSMDIQAIDDAVQIEREMSKDATWASLFTDPVERRKLFYACGVMFVQQINGIQFWYTYGVVFAQSIGVADPFTINTIIYVLQIVSVGVSVVFGNKIKRRTNLLVCSVGIFVSLVAVGGLGTTRAADGSFSRGIGIGIVVLAYLNIIFYNFSIGTLSYSIASEMSVGRNRNKITSCAMAVFFLTVWLMVFTSPYMYYDGNLGPKIGFVYGGTTLLLLAFSWYCVGETAGRTNADIERLFQDKVPVREWATYVIPTDEVTYVKNKGIEDEQIEMA
ncbi:Major facilitator superfamily domain general substrate transporter [Penicillium cf. griseofulvum]|uniref:Major facilitator superfamily domain general substrate transporter n=1 Tax=Penicillium cf. griseofulvum TaxID=2972120 RepID=A0A9W9T5P5_9EURO|nr:Major facilitator superfamily domain general substrate transporter [Penicillium cf. griseofulvum]KAJ5421593.1 Major facilitator superfamily domain general substrate transporter [Penicillium cf. griseofulvum]KAJ5424832.1 Major facilitator superfamily domain general substrate transporter [Penicillium cf. griseofulvum]